MTAAHPARPQRTGLALPANLGLPVAGYVDVARQAEALGYSRIWAAEAGNNDAFGLLTACACATSRIGLGTGVVPIFTRTPALMAASAATLQDASGGRFTLGVGVSSPTIVERWNGVPLDRPLDRIRAYVGVVSALLRGERVDRDDALYPVRGYRLLMPVPDPPPPIVLGALNQRMLSTAGEVASGALLNWLPATAVPAAVARVREGGADASVAVFVRACVTADVAAARAWARREVMGYVTAPAYRKAFDAAGWADVTAPALERWAAGDRAGAAGSLPDTMVDALCVAGTADDVRARFAEFRAPGVDEPVVFPFSAQRAPEAALAEVADTLTALAPDGPPSA
jgi:probable F420-dependent oxidoreductase